MLKQIIHYIYFRLDVFFDMKVDVTGDIKTPNYYAKLQKSQVICYDVNDITKFNLCNLLFSTRKYAS